jgi:protein gp37
MSLTKASGNMYTWVTDLWNPQGGECPHGCPYCTTNPLAAQYPGVAAKYSGAPRLIPHELSTKLGEGKIIFVVAQNDLFAKDTPIEFADKVISHCEKYPKNQYLFQSKNPAGFIHFMNRLHFINSILCTTIETNRFYPKHMGKTPHPEERAKAMAMMSHFKRYVTIEPIMDFDLPELIKLIKMCDPVQVNVGGDSGGNNLPEPSKEKISELIYELNKFTVIDRKKNLERIFKA